MPKEPENIRGADATPNNEILPEHSLRGGVRGKYAARYAVGTNLIPLDPDVAEVFPDPVSVNRALRAIVGIIKEQQAHKPAA
jgi:hypothetical protein